MLTTQTTARAQQGVMAMRVNREFPPEIAHKLETVQGEDLVTALAQIPDQPEGEVLPDWQVKGIEEALKDVKAGRVVPHEKVAAWIDSIGTDHELPRPKCK